MSQPPARNAVRRYGPVAAILVAVVVIAAVVIVNRGGGGGGDDQATAAGAGGGFHPRGVLSWSQAKAAGTTGSTPWGRRCDTRRGTLAVPVADPGECYAPFHGDNGGATAPGVTGDAIKVVVYQPQPGDPIIGAVSGAVNPDASETNAQVASALHDWLRFFEAYHETYGRRVDLVTYTATGIANDEVAARADATQIVEQFHPFAVIGGPPLTSVFGDALTARHVLCLDCILSQSIGYYADRAPYLVGSPMNSEEVYLHLAEFVGKQLGGRPAGHAGDPALRTKRRKFGQVYIAGNKDATDHQRQFERDLQRYHVRIDPAIAYTSIGDFQTDAPAIVARLKAAGVTTVIFVGDPLAPGPMTTAATGQDYFPEWVVSGIGYTDTTTFARTYDQRQWAHAFGITFLPTRVDPATNAVADLYTWFFGRKPSPSTGGAALADLNLLYTFVERAGPDLSPRTFGQALFARPPTPGSVTRPSQSWGDHGRWPFTDYGGVDDATVIWWDPQATGPDETDREGTGMYRYVDGGRRYLPGAWPSAPLGLFRPAGSVTVYDKAPDVGPLPRYRPLRP